MSYFYQLPRRMRIGMPASASVLRGKQRAGQVPHPPRQPFGLLPGERGRGNEGRRVPDECLRDGDAGTGHRHREARAGLPDRRAVHSFRLSAAHGQDRKAGQSVGDVVCHARGPSGAAGPAPRDTPLAHDPGHRPGPALCRGALRGTAPHRQAAVLSPLPPDHEHTGLLRRNDAR